jgi:uncharacterized protein YjbI with pentapeptide repeats
MPLTNERRDISSYLASDDAFDELFPVHIQKLSKYHWTPLNVARSAALYLGADASARVLDIGAGVGKFCIAGSCFSRASFTGIEQRKNFVQLGNKVISQMGIRNASLMHGNFTDLDFANYTGIYFYNSFHENIVAADALDDKVECSPELYDLYTEKLHEKLNGMPAGTKLATFWLTISEIPGCYKLVDGQYSNLLKFWVKEA